MKSKIAIIGLGFVGLTFASFLGSRNIKVLGIEKDSKKIQSIRKGDTYFYETDLAHYLKKALNAELELQTNITKDITTCDFIFVTVGTPTNKHGKINLEFLKSVIHSIGKEISESNNVPTIVIKSTVVPKTTTEIVKPILESYSLKESIDFDLISNPEFLREGNAMRDTISPHAIIIGGSKKPVKKLIKFYKNIYPNYQNFIETNEATAELIKYANNTFLATKLSFINSISNICQKIEGTDVDVVAKAIGMDPRIGNLFLKAGPGYGGSCFPKDVQALIGFSKELGDDPKLLNAVKKINEFQVDVILNIIKKNIRTLNGKKIGILGLSFKENTDDIRESISIKLIKKLLKYNSELKVHDPKALANTYEVFGDKINYCKKASYVFNDVCCVILLTPWEEYKKLNEKEFLKMSQPFIIDTRRILKISNKKIKYVGVGIGSNT